jgi:hypothetical protein
VQEDIKEKALLNKSIYLYLQNKILYLDLYSPASAVIKLVIDLIVQPTLSDIKINAEQEVFYDLLNLRDLLLSALLPPLRTFSLFHP